MRGQRLQTNPQRVRRLTRFKSNTVAASPVYLVVHVAAGFVASKGR